MTDKVILEEKDAVTYAIINREAKRNAVDYDVMNQLEAIIDNVEQQKNMGCLVITGSGRKAFCSGGDLSVFHKLHTKEEALPMLKKMSRVITKLYFLSKPTVALLNGAAVGGGAEIAAACDFRFAAAHAKIGFVQSKLAITTGWGGGSILFERIREEEAFELLLSGRVVSTDEAVKLGLVQKILKGEDIRFECENYLQSWLSIEGSVLSTYKMRKLDRTNQELLKKRIEREVIDCAYLWGEKPHLEAVEDFRAKK
ncbi:enoyl-CoA hydratase/isomerase family protein [Alteribacillus sp. HJP-4]|uniref:enoyl-CoA hydratase/isomerase family protein n=1 Tax=Alteribacillus sp. HJP-4 TaxID=2775394 RepID=UPI0035CD1770